MHHEVCADKQERRRHYERKWPISIGILLLLLPVSATLADTGRDFQATITFEQGYRFQGIDQSQGSSTLHASGQYRLTDNLSAGAWIGKYKLPYDRGESKEIDYFLGYSKRLAFDRWIETSIWRYTFTDSHLRNYNWTQWLTRYHIGERFSVTFGLSDNFMVTDELSTFVEGTARRSFGKWIAGVSVGRNNLSGTVRDSFEYVQFRAVYNQRNWHIFANYTLPGSIDDAITSSFVSEGAGFGISYTL